MKNTISRINKIIQIILDFNSFFNFNRVLVSMFWILLYFKISRSNVTIPIANGTENMITMAKTDDDMKFFMILFALIFYFFNDM